MLFLFLLWFHASIEKQNSIFKLDINNNPVQITIKLKRLIKNFRFSQIINNLLSLLVILILLCINLYEVVRFDVHAFVILYNLSKLFLLTPRDWSKGTK